MSWQLENGRPIWVQLTEVLTLRIVSGVYEPGGAVPPVRTLAAEAGVNPNTMQRALAELENQGLLETRRTAGRTVTDDLFRIQTMRKQLALERINAFLSSMHALGFDEAQTRALMDEWKKEEHTDE